MMNNKNLTYGFNYNDKKKQKQSFLEYHQNVVFEFLK